MNEKLKINIRNGKPSDHARVVAVMPQWWGGRDLSSSVLKVFFVHFSNTTFIAEDGNDLVGFLIGFMSQSEKDVGYIHFAGVHPDYRKTGLGRTLFEKFYEACKVNNRSVVKSCTSPVNKLSIKFHQKMGFMIEPGDGIIDGVPVSPNYLGKDNPKVLFKKELNER